MSKRSRPMHRTYTSPEVKNRWNQEHYDRVELTLPKGAKAELKAAAERHGQTVAAYVRSLVIRDNADFPQDIAILTGGGVADRWESLMQQRTGKPELCYDLDAEPGQLTLDGRKNAVLDLLQQFEP